MSSSKSNFASIILFIFFSSIIFVGADFLYANELQIKWREPWVHDPSYHVQSFTSRKNGFEIYLSKSKRKTSWHVQIISDDTIELKENKYVIKFRARSNKKFKLYSRLGEEVVSEGNSYIDHSWPVIGDGDWHTYRLDFVGKDIANFLYFQLGKALSGTRFEIADITIQSI